MVVKCLTVHQPWAWAIVRGHLMVISRPRQTFHRGLVLIHAAEVRDGATAADRFLLGHQPLPGSGELACGALVGCAELVDCFRPASVPRARAPGRGQWSWLLTNPSDFVAPIPCSGRSHIWELPDELNEVLRSACRRKSRPASAEPASSVPASATPMLPLQIPQTVEIARAKVN